MLAVLACGATVTGQVGPSGEITAILAHTPEPQAVAPGRELSAAEAAAAGLKHAVAFLGVGDSMEPLYETNTAVVVVPIRFGAIENGMTVVYVNRYGFRVAHTVVAKSAAGYVVQGLRNQVTDPDPVTERNLVGVIVQAFASHVRDFHQRLTLRLRQLRLGSAG